MLKPVNRLLKIIAVTACLLVLTGFTAFFILLISPVQQRILKYITNYADNLVTGSVSIGSVSTNLLSVIDLNDINFTDTTDTGNYLTVDHIRINYLLPLLLYKRISLPRITVDGVKAGCTITPEGKFLFPVLPVGPGASDTQHTAIQKVTVPWKVKIDNVVVRNINAEFNDLANHQSGSIRKGVVTAQIPNIDSISVQLVVSQGSYSSPWWNGSVQKINAKVTFLPQCLKVSKVLVHSDHSQLVGKGLIPFNDNGLWNVGATVSSDIQSIPALLNNLPDLKPVGSIAGNALWTGTMSHPVLDLNIGMYHADFKDIIIDTAHISAQYDASSQLTGTFALSSSAGSVTTTLSGEITRLFSFPELGGYTIDTRVQQIVPEKITPLKLNFPEYIQGSTLSAALHAAGIGTTSLPKTISCKGTSLLPRLSEQPVGFDASWQDSTLSLSIINKNNRLQGTCRYRSDHSISGSIDVALVDFADFSSRLLMFPLKGAIDGRISCRGTVQNPEFIAYINGKSISWRDATVDSLQGTLHISKDSVYVDSMFLSANALLDSLLDPFYDLDIKGNASVTVSGKGPLPTPDIAASIRGENIAYQSFRVDSVSAELSMTNRDSVYLTDSYLLLGNKSAGLRCRGTFSMEALAGNVAIELETSSHGEKKSSGKLTVAAGRHHDSIFADLDIGQFSLLPLSSLLSLDKNLSGVINASGNLSGTINNPSVNIELNISNPGYDHFRLLSTTVRALLSDSMATVSADILVPNSSEKIRARASIPLLPNSSWHIDTSSIRDFFITVKSEKVPVGFFSGLLDSNWQAKGDCYLDLSAHLENRQPVLSGGVSLKHGSIENAMEKVSISDIAIATSLSGSYRNPEAAIRITTGPIRIFREQINRLDFKGTASPDNLTITTGDLYLADSGLVSLQGHVSLAKMDSLFSDTTSHINFSIVQLPLSLASSLTPGIRIQDGTIQGKGSILLRDGKPEVNGYISLTNGFAVFDEIQPAIGPVTMMVTLSGDSIILQKMEVVWGKGSAQASGSVVLRPHELPFVTASCTGENLAWNLPEVIEGAIDHVRLEWSTAKDMYFISGKLSAGPCRYTQDIQIADLLSQLRTTSSSNLPALPSKDSTMNKIQMNITVDLQDNVAVDMNLGYLKIDGDISLTGVLANPSYTGELSLSEGYVYYLDRRFTIDHATLINYNPQTLNPRIVLEATSDVTAFNGEKMESYTILLSVSGDLENPVVTFREKTGALNQLEIVSILTFGQSTGGMSGDVKERLRTFIGESVLGFGTRKLEHIFGIEKIDLQGDVFGGKKAAAASRVTIAKRVTPRLTILYETAIGSLEKPKIATLFRITNNLFLSGERSSDGKAGVDLIFKYSK